MSDHVPQHQGDSPDVDPDRLTRLARLLEAKGLTPEALWPGEKRGWQEFLEATLGSGSDESHRIVALHMDPPPGVPRIVGNKVIYDVEEPGE